MIRDPQSMALAHVHLSPPPRGGLTFADFLRSRAFLLDCSVGRAARFVSTYCVHSQGDDWTGWEAAARATCREHRLAPYGLVEDLRIAWMVWSEVHGSASDLSVPA